MIKRLAIAASALSMAVGFVTAANATAAETPSRPNTLHSATTHTTAVTGTHANAAEQQSQFPSRIAKVWASGGKVHAQYRWGGSTNLSVLARLVRDDYWSDDTVDSAGGNGTSVLNLSWTCRGTKGTQYRIEASSQIAGIVTRDVSEWVYLPCSD